MKDRNLVLIANRKWKEGDPASDRLMIVPLPEDAYNAEIRETARGYVVSYDLREERERQGSDDSIILHPKEERFLHVKRFFNGELQEDAQWQRTTEWTVIVDTSALPADFKQPASSWS